jgi:hypothetical protein
VGVALNLQTGRYYEVNMHQQIGCPLCQKAESDFSRINQGINRAPTLAEKASHARELIQKVDTLLKEHENVESSLAEACRAVLNLRKKAAEIVLKLEKVKR